MNHLLLHPPAVEDPKYESREDLNSIVMSWLLHLKATKHQKNLSPSHYSQGNLGGSHTELHQGWHSCPTLWIKASIYQYLRRDWICNWVIQWSQRFMVWIRSIWWYWMESAADTQKLKDLVGKRTNLSDSSGIIKSRVWSGL